MNLYYIYIHTHNTRKAHLRQSNFTKKMSTYEIEILPNGRWRNKYPDYVIFNNHIKEGEHSCHECKCSYCQAPSIFNIIHVTNKTDGRNAGFMYCLDCLKKERKNMPIAEGVKN